MRIVVLDGYTTNPGDLDWGGLENLGDLTVYERTSQEDLLDRARNAEVLFTNKTVLDSNTIESLPKLRYIGVLATGVNVVDLEAAQRHNIIVSNVAGYGSSSVAQHTFALLLELTNKVAVHDAAVHEGEWVKCKDFCFTKHTLVELKGLTFGIIGLGSIGLAVAEIAKGFGMNVLATVRSEKNISGIEIVTMDTLFAYSDVVSLHCPLTSATEKIINAESLKKMKSSAFLINTGRGALIDENALTKALKKSWIAGAALDVLSTEPPEENNPLLSAPRCIITPHIAWASKAARTRLLNIAIQNYKDFLNSKKK